MKILLDTNIVLDYLGANEGFTDEAEAVLDLADGNNLFEFVSASAVTDIYYVLKRALKDRELVKEKFSQFREKIGILPVSAKDIDTAFLRDWKDFEDAVQYTVAESNGVDYIVTRNVKDFEENTIPVLTPVDFIELIKEQLNNKQTQ